MKFVRTLLVIGLILSLALNFALAWRNERLRPQFTVNGRKFSKREYHDYLEQHHGISAQAEMIQNYLVTDAAKKEGVMPSDAEVKKLADDQEEADPKIAFRDKTQLAARADLEQRIQTELALFNVATKSVKPTEDELKTYYEAAGPHVFDAQGKVYTRMMGSVDSDPQKKAEYVTRAKDLVDAMSQRYKVEAVSPGVEQKLLPDISMVQSQLAPHIGFYFGDGRRVFRSSEPAYAKLSALKPGDSIILDDQQLGKVLLYVEKKIEPRSTTLSDPETHVKVERAYKSAHAGGNLMKQKLRELWDAADIQVDPEPAKAEIEKLILPERAIEKAKK